jgi:hypothetical protein
LLVVVTGRWSMDVDVTGHYSSGPKPKTEVECRDGGERNPPRHSERRGSSPPRAHPNRGLPNHHISKKNEQGFSSHSTN